MGGARALFADRLDAGRRLAEAVRHLADDDVVVLGLPRGGVPVAAEVARALHAPLDVIVVRKLGVPHQPELAMGAIGEGGVRVLNEEVIHLARVTADDLAVVEGRERAELERRAQRFRTGRDRIPLAGRVALVVDDGIATGSTARAACQVARAHGAARVVLAVPVAPPVWQTRLGEVADELIAVATPEQFYAVGQFYDDFTQVGDDEVVDCLQRAHERTVGDARSSGPHARVEELALAVGPAQVGGRLTVPAAATGVVVFAHGSGSSRHSPRNRHVADVLQRAGLGTLLFDLLTPEEEVDRENVFDIGLLARRLLDVTGWVRADSGLHGLPVGYFGASTGAAAALAAAAEAGPAIGAVVSRGGRPDLAGPLLASVTAPTLLIVGGRDDVVLRLNREAQRHLRCPNHLTVIPGATHLFEEPGTLDAAATAARDWFTAHLVPRSATGP